MGETKRPQIGLLIVDLDNTLWDWVDVWVRSFSALLEGVAAETGIALDDLKAEIREIHQKRGTTEYSLLLDEMESLKPFLDGMPARERFREAIHAQNSIRKHSTVLFPTVLPALLDIKSRGAKIIAYTESVAFWTEWRIRLTGLDGVIDVLYSAPDHDFPAGLSPKEIRTLPSDSYGLRVTEHRHVERGIVKPNPRVLQEIVAEHGPGARGIAYVGDNVSKDIVMAQAVGVYDVHAAYGEAHARPEYALLREVTHWTPEAVAKEKTTTPGELPAPTFVLKDRFAEIFDHFEFGGWIEPGDYLDVWKKVVDVQQHFNDLGWRIRALALTALTFALGATGFTYVNAGRIPQLGNLSAAAFVPLLGLVLWAAFWFMDAAWFHRLLKGSVDEGIQVEGILKQAGMRVDLGSHIGRASPLGKLHSTGKLNLFYGVIALVLSGLSLLFFLLGAPPAKDPPAEPVVNVYNFRG